MPEKEEKKINYGTFKVSEILDAHMDL